MAYGDSNKKISWAGECDGTPSSKPTNDLRDYPELRKPKGDDWKGMVDGTPSSKPNGPADS